MENMFVVNVVSDALDSCILLIGEVFLFLRKIGLTDFQHAVAIITVAFLFAQFHFVQSMSSFLDFVIIVGVENADAVYQQFGFLEFLLGSRFFGLINQ